MTTATSIITKVRRAFKDMPDFTQSTGSVDGTTNPVTITVTAGDGSKVPTPGARVEWGDGTGETGNVISIPGTDQWQILRSDYGESLSTHAAGARVFIDPRFEENRILDVIRGCVNQWWPTVWVPLETTLAYQAAADYYSPTVTDIEEASYAYQIYSGTFTRYDARYVAPVLADNANFPNGVVLIDRGELIAGQTLYLAYKAIPQIADDGTTNMLARQENLVVEGTVAKLTMFEEANQVGPSALLVSRMVPDAAKLRAGSVLWQQYEADLQMERARLLADELDQGVVVRG